MVKISLNPQTNLQKAASGRPRGGGAAIELGKYEGYAGKDVEDYHPYDSMNFTNVYKDPISKYQKYSVPTGQNKLLGIDKGGILDKALTINSGSGNAIIASNTYSFTHSNGTVFHNTSSNAATYQQSFSGIARSLPKGYFV